MRTAAEYHALAQGISDIYWQELQRGPDEGGWIEWFHHLIEEGHDLNWVRARVKESEEWHAIHDQPQPRALPPLTVEGHVFRAGGQPFTVKQCSDFNLLGRLIKEGEAPVREVMKQRADYGFNMLRVWAWYDGGRGNAFEAEIGRLVPQEHPDYYDRLAQLYQLASAYGLYVEMTVFTGPTNDVGHWINHGTFARNAGNAILELVNEHTAHPSIDLSLYRKIDGVLCSHGSNGSQATPVRPAWDYETFHTNDAFEWWRKGGHNGMEFSAGAEGIPASRVPVLVNEKTRPDRDGNVNHHRDDAAGCALLTAGSCYHSASGKKSALFDERDATFAREFILGCNSINLAFQFGAYGHPIEQEQREGLLRMYTRSIGNASETARIRR